MLLYSRFQWTQGDKDMDVTEVGRGSRTADVDTDIGKYVIGANYYPMSSLSFSAQYYYRTFEQDYSHVFAGLTGASIAEHDTDTSDFNLRMTWRALPNLTLVSRYDYTQTDIDNRVIGLSKIESADITRNIFSQSVTWMPLSRMYVQ